MVDALKKKQTITSTALRLGTFRLVFSGSFFPYSWNGQCNRPLGSLDMNSPLQTLVREVIRTADKNASQVEICTVCEYGPFHFISTPPLWKKSVKIYPLRNQRSKVPTRAPLQKLPKFSFPL